MKLPWEENGIGMVWARLWAVIIFLQFFVYVGLGAITLTANEPLLFRLIYLVIIAIIFSIITIIPAKGLWERKEWAWYLNWLYIYGPLVSIVQQMNKNFEVGLAVFCITFLFWILPNHKYWMRRKEIFEDPSSFEGGLFAIRRKHFIRVPQRSSNGAASDLQDSSANEHGERFVLGARKYTGKFKSAIPIKTRVESKPIDSNAKKKSSELPKSRDEKDSPAQDKSKNDFYLVAWKELKEKRFDRSVWLKCFAENQGEKKATIACYLKARVEILEKQHSAKSS